VHADSADEPLGHLVVDTGADQLNVPIFDQLFVGRECAGISERRRLVLADPEVSRNHFEIRLDAATDQAVVIDTSTNGTSLNGMPLARAVPQAITPEDQIRIGDITMIFRSRRFRTAQQLNPMVTHARISEGDMVMVVGDITNYSTISQVTDNKVTAQSLYSLWHSLEDVLRAHRGTLNHYAGDALYAVWELRTLPQAGALAIEFALAANQLVEELGPTLPLRSPDGSPIHMGWAVVQGKAARAAMTRSVEAVIGDSTNLAFRLAGLAGRHGRAAVMVTGAVHDAVEAQFNWGSPEQVETKGRQGMETVFPVTGRRATGPPDIEGHFRTHRRIEPL
jgi:adenylate cyclase